MEKKLLENDFENYSIDSDFFIKSNIKADKSVSQNSSKFSSSSLKSSQVKTKTTTLSNKNDNILLVKVHRSDELKESECTKKNKNFIVEKKNSSFVSDRNSIVNQPVCKKVEYLYRSPSQTGKDLKNDGLNSLSSLHCNSLNIDLSDKTNIISSENKSFLTDLNNTKSNFTSNASTSELRHESFLTKFSENSYKTNIGFKKCALKENSLKNQKDALSSFNINYNRVKAGRRAAGKKTAGKRTVKKSPKNSTHPNPFRRNPRQQFIKTNKKSTFHSNSPKNIIKPYHIKIRTKQINHEKEGTTKKAHNKYEPVSNRLGKYHENNDYKQHYNKRNIANSPNTSGTTRFDLPKNHNLHTSKKDDISKFDNKNIPTGNDLPKKVSSYEKTGSKKTINDRLLTKYNENSENEIDIKDRPTNKSQEGYTEYGMTESLVANKSVEKVESNDSVRSIASAEGLLNNSISERERTISNFDDKRREKKFVTKYFATLIVFMCIVTSLVLVLSRIEKVRRNIIKHHFLWIIPLALLISMGITIFSSEQIRRKQNVGVFLLTMLAICSGLLIGFFAGAIHMIFPFLVSLNLLTVLGSLFLYSNYKKTTFNRFLSLGLVTVITVILTILQSALIKKVIDLIVASLVSLTLSYLLVIDVSMILRGMHTYEMDERDYLFAILSLPIFIWQDVKFFKHW